MNRETLMDAIGCLPEDMLAEVAAKRVRRPVRWIPWSVAAACLCLLLTRSYLCVLSRNCRVVLSYDSILLRYICVVLIYLAVGLSYSVVI